MKICPRCHLEYHDDDHDVCVMDGTKLEAATDPRIGKLVLGRYVIDGQLGAGGMATVYRAHESTTGRAVAVKVMHANLARDRDLRERFRREARIAAALVHENIVEIFDAGETEDHEPVIVMALLVGHTLREVIAKGPMPLGLAVALGVQIARALARAHDLGVVHRDLKPENVFVVDESGRRTAKLVDFGIARARHESRLTAAGMMVGTPAYLAPERIKGRENDPASDLYSFGVVLYEMITGQLPFQCTSLPAYVIAHLDTPPPSPAAAVPSCPKPLESLVLRLLAKDPADRPVDAHSVGRDLETIRFLVGPVPAARDSAPPSPPRPVRASQAVTLERWERRALLLEQMLRRAFRQDDAPSELVRTLDDLRDAVVELEVLRKARLARQQTIDDVDASAREARERLGHAVHELGVDLSKAREDLARLKAELEARDAQVKDLEFQIDVLRKKLDESQDEAHAQRASAQDELASSGTRIEALRRAIGQQSRLLLGALRDHPDNRELVEELERA
jgi:serine/threonine-protein kinase